ncbi:phosphatase PAP2 family protein [Herbinix luporum]|jgi:membrane-associated phospholipid phosphatase|uniref:Putative membrane protein n=1 Tax=Herbinix luporum TaxID=1679721 RepID=A0A0K8J347_9FIRM|nr:phosphatase PAP2 family protein [Herbinix luporum]CUH91728.1 putative membrane protein [Herbinix luporum]HHT56026.1 phosphatase PAP2 family protein [Herbinix luporum]
MKFNKNKDKKFIHILSQYRHGLVLVYFFIYMIWFTYLERTVTTEFTPVYSRLDDYIPFLEIFIIPYFIWFAYIFVTVAYFFFTSKQDFYKCCAFLFIGMTICLIIYTIWPNGHYLRVDIDNLGRSNIFTRILSRLYTIDTSTNVFPSIHVFNSIGAMIAIRKSERLRPITWLQISTFILTVLICMSTVFLKQHSILDVFGGILLSIIMYIFVYVPAWGKEAKKADHELSKI